MATVSEVAGTLKILTGANLHFTPTDDKLPGVVKVWSKLLGEIPGPILEQAAWDLVATEDEFPTLAKMRKAATQVKIHNGASAATDHFKPLAAPKVVWLPTGTKDLVIFPPAVQTEIDRLAAKDYLTDAELTAIDALTAPYREVL